LFAFIEWDPDPVLVTIGPLSLRYYSVLFGLGFIIALAILCGQFEEEGERPSAAGPLAYGLLAGTLIGSRLGHILFYEGVGEYLANPLLLFDFRRGGLASHGGTVGVLVAMFIWAHWRKVPFRVAIDRVVMTVPVLGITVRLGNFFNSEIFGRPTDVPWAVVFARVREPDLTAIPAGLSEQALAFLPEHIPRHPSQLYEVIMNVAVMVLLVAVDHSYRSKGKRRPLGLMTGLFFTSYMGLRIILENFKEYLTLSPGGLTMGQWLSLPFLVLGIGCVWAATRGPWKEQDAVAFLRAKGFGVDSGSESPGE